MYKDNQYLTWDEQLRRIFSAFKKSPCTMLMCARRTGIERANICRAVEEFRERKTIVLVRKGTCKISRHGAGYYSTNLKAYPLPAEDPQLKMTL